MNPSFWLQSLGPISKRAALPGDTVADQLAAIPEVDYVVICAGGYDLLVELVCTDDEHLLNMLNDAIRSVPGVIGTETFMYLKLAKQTYAWGTR